jgi:hypothetical protein
VRLSPQLPASIGGWRVRLDDTSNVSELLEAPSNPKEPKMLRGSSQNGNAVGCSTLDLGHTDITTVGVGSRD